MPRFRLPLLASLLGLLVLAPSAVAADCPNADLQPTAANVVAARAAVVCLTNAERANAGLPALTPEGHLEAAAQAFSQRMVTEQFFDHVAPDGSQLVDRLSSYLDWSSVGENIAWGQGALGTPRGTVNAWMNSAGHRANILSAAYTEVGIGMVAGAPQASSQAAATWTQDFGARRSSTPAAPVQTATTTAPAPAAAAPATAPAAPAAVATATAKPKPAGRCARGKVRRVVRSHSRRLVRCVVRTKRVAR